MPDRKIQFLSLKADCLRRFKLSEKCFDWLYSQIVATNLTQKGIADVFVRHFGLPMSESRVYRLTRVLKAYMQQVQKEDYDLKFGRVANKQNTETPI